MPWCDYMAVKLDREKPEEDNHPQVLLRRVYYSKSYVEEWMKPRLLYFSKCLLTRKAPHPGLYRFPNLDTQCPPPVQEVQFDTDSLEFPPVD